MRQISGNALASINAHETSEVWLPLVVLTHDDWDEPIRIVRNLEPIVHQSETFLPFPFDVSLPDEDAESTSVIQWVAANASSELLELFRQVSGPISGSVFWIIASSPDDIEIGPFNLELRAFEYNATEIKGSLMVEPVLDAVFGHTAMNGSNAPGLF